MSESTPTRIAIIGGGFSGVMTAVNLARLAKRPLHLLIINHQRPTGRGVAYGTRRMEHLLNVAARNMSAFPDQPDHFLQWLRSRSEYDDMPERELREKFIPRMIYGDYLRSILHNHLQANRADTRVQTEFVEGEAVDVEVDEKGALVYLRNGAQLEVNRVVLATGNEAPAEMAGAETLHEHAGWIGNPWLPWHEKLPTGGGTIILLGTGLTTIDAVITLRAMGWQGEVHAVSRHGWLPKSHFRGIEYADFPPVGIDLAALGLKELAALMQAHCARLREVEANPAIIVDKLRPYTQRIWANFSVEERLTFAQNYAARWNVLRHRIAPEIHAQVASAQLTGQLTIHAARIERVEAAGARVRVHRDHGAPLEGDLVINATGPQTRFSATRSLLLQNLLRRGIIASDAMDMGVSVDEDHIALLPDGSRSQHLLALGPLLRGTLWETIAVPELRGQARRVAETLLQQTVRHEPEPVMMEFMI
ncbi:MAG: FAD/NAD(P)-binding protein [Verrucomicrobiales bacterium]|nr:FAD/NAD(P)-binding protein [Verrucomicrobiales bacterium]MCP5560839.1 FAD/NAD(P)-binding protein [Verrucomicrobiaceae bacterium]